MIDPSTITCDMTVDGERVQWIGAKALYREVNAARAERKAAQDAIREDKRQRMMRGGR